MGGIYKWAAGRLFGGRSAVRRLCYIGSLGFMLTCYFWCSWLPKSQNGGAGQRRKQWMGVVFYFSVLVYIYFFGDYWMVGGGSRMGWQAYIMGGGMVGEGGCRMY